MVTFLHSQPVLKIGPPSRQAGIACAILAGSEPRTSDLRIIERLALSIVDSRGLDWSRERPRTAGPRHGGGCVGQDTNAGGLIEEYGRRHPEDQGPGSPILGPARTGQNGGSQGPDRAGRDAFAAVDRAARPGGTSCSRACPGLAKTTAIKALAAAIHCKFNRIQFTPDLLPADLIGTLIYNPREGAFSTRKGPIFANLILADEINRAPSKVQSALLEAMQEHQVTIGDESFTLDEPFLVLATQNPIEQEGTYPLPEAQVDRFMLKVVVGYPSTSDERKVVDVALDGLRREVQPVLESGAARRHEADGRLHLPG